MSFGLKYYADMDDAPVYDLLIQASIKTKNHFMNFFILVVNIVQTLAELKYTLKYWYIY